MKLSYLERGEGRPLVLLHGYLSSKESFYPQLEYFSSFYRVFALDFPSMGGAESLTAAWSVDDYADWTRDALASLGVENAIVMAHSFGGRVALKLLARGEFSAGVLIGCAGVVPKRGISYRVRVGAYRAVKKIFPAFAESHFGSSDFRALSPVMRESFKKIVNEDLRAVARTISRPVLFAVGEADRETPPAAVQLLHECVEGSSLVVMKGCGHFAHLDDPLTFHLAAEEFLHART